MYTRDMRAAPARTVGPHDWRDFIALDEDDLRELIDGHFVEVEVPSHHHERIVAEVTATLVLWARRHGGHVVASGYKVRISNKSGVMPSIARTTRHPTIRAKGSNMEGPISSSRSFRRPAVATTGS